MRNFAGAVVAAFVALMLFALPASAGREWCEKDPIVQLNDTRVQILVAVPVEDQRLVSGPIHVTIATPAGTERSLIFTDAGFNGFGEVVAFTDLAHPHGPPTALPAAITVRVPLRERATVPLRVTVIADGAAPVVRVGSSDNTTVRLRIAGAGR